MREGEGRERERRDTAWPDPSLVYATPLLIHWKSVDNGDDDPVPPV